MAIFSNEEVFPLNLTNDVLFKRTFADEKEPENLMCFLNAMQENLAYPLFEHLEIKNPVLFSDSVDLKIGILDIKAQDTQGKLIDVEMQLYSHEAYTERSLYYLAKLYGNQLSRGADYTELKQCIGIHLLNFILFSNDKDYHSSFAFRKDKENAMVLSRHMLLQYIEIPKIQLKKKELNSLEKWIYLIVNANKRRDPMVQELRNANPQMDKTIDKYDQLISDERVRYEAMSRDKWEKDQATIKRFAYMKGEAKGKAEGKAEGLAITARNLKAKNFSSADIAEITGLSLEEIEKL